MKKYVFFLLILLSIALVGCSSKEIDPNNDNFKIALITDYSNIDDQSFNQATYEGCRDFSNENDIDFTYIRPSEDSTAERINAVETAINHGFNIIIMPGYEFSAVLYECTNKYPETIFVALDMSKNDILDASVGADYDGNPNNWKLDDYLNTKNLYCISFKEEISGYLAGYSTVMLGYKNLGFIGGMDIPAVKRYGYGYIQGAEDAAKQNDTIVNINYAYANQFYEDDYITDEMNKWYQNGIEVVFSCGGDIYKSVAKAAALNDAKIIGVDVDQKHVIDTEFNKNLTLTSAMKGIYQATYDTLTDIIVNKAWLQYSGKFDELGLVSEKNPEKNYCQIPIENTQFNEKYTVEDYKKLVFNIYSGNINIDNDVTEFPQVEKVIITDLGKLNN